MDDNVKALAERISTSDKDDIQPIIAEIASLDSETQKIELLRKLASRHRLDKRALQRDLKRIKKEKSGGGKGYLATFPGLVELVVNEAGQVAYLVNNAGNLEEVTEITIDGQTYHPPEPRLLPYRHLLPANDIRLAYLADDHGQLFNDIIAYLKRFSSLEESQWAIIACKIILTWLQDHPGVHFQPMLLFYAVAERGKTRTCAAILSLAWRGVHVVDLRESNLFRFSRNLGATLFFDVMDLWKKAEHCGSEDILLLRFQKGAQVARVLNPDKGAFLDTEYFPVYGPTLIASNTQVHKILGSRCINIVMPNAPGVYEDPGEEKGLPLKTRLAAWRARQMFKPLPVVEKVDGIDGRLWDISKPLLQVCSMVWPEGFDELVDALRDQAREKREEKQDSSEGLIVKVLSELSVGQMFATWTFEHRDVLEKINSHLPADGKKWSPQYLTRRLQALGIRTSKGAKNFSKVKIDRESLATLRNQYGFDEFSENESGDIPF